MQGIRLRSIFIKIGEWDRWDTRPEEMAANSNW